MPNGRVHSAACVVTALASGGSAYYSGIATLPVAFDVVVGALLGIMLSPDLDVDRGNISNYYIRKFSPVAAWIWRAFWWPYAKAFRHRGISHWPVIGTCSRILYISVYVALFTIVLALFNKSVRLLYSWELPVLVGLMLSDSVHALLDKLF